MPEGGKTSYGAATPQEEKLMKKVIMVLAPGFEELEAVAVADLLRRIGVELTLAGLGGREITADSNDERLNEREARSVWGRNEKRLLAAYEMGSKPLFAAVCMYQQMSDDEWHAAKAKAKKEIQEAEG